MISPAPFRVLRLGLVALALTAATSAVAQTPPAGPICTGGTVSHTFTIRSHLSLNFPWYTNVISVPAVSSFHGTGVPSDTGFHRICEAMGLTIPGLPGTLDIDGDSQPDDATLSQVDPTLGFVKYFTCDGTHLDPFPWEPSQAVVIELFTTTNSDATLTIDGDECTQPYAAYRMGIGAYGFNLVPIPYTSVARYRREICENLNLPSGSSLKTWEPIGSTVQVYLCGQLDIYGPVPAGHGVLVEPLDPPTAAVPYGAPVNCANPSATPPVCPATPAPNEYPCPRLSASDPLPWYCN